MKVRVTFNLTTDFTVFLLTRHKHIYFNIHSLFCKPFCATRTLRRERTKKMLFGKDMCVVFSFIFRFANKMFKQTGLSCASNLSVIMSLVKMDCTKTIHTFNVVDHRRTYIIDIRYCNNFKLTLVKTFSLS